MGDALGQAGHTGLLPSCSGALKDVYRYINTFEVGVPGAAPGLAGFRPGGWEKEKLRPATAKRAIPLGE